MEQPRTLNSPARSKMKQFARGLGMAICLLAAGAAVAQTSHSDWDWAIASPESEGMSGTQLKSMTKELASRNTSGFLVVRNDKIVWEWYAPGAGATIPHGIASMAKAVVGGVSLALALTDKKLSLDDKAATFITQWQNDPRKSQITIRQLGSHTSGMADAEDRDLPHEKLTGWAGEFWKNLPPPQDPFTIARDRTPMLYEPGTRLQYSNPGMAMLAYVITAALKDGPEKNLRVLLRDRVMEPIGVPKSEWSIGYGKTDNVDGLPLVATWGGAQYTARAVARVGRLMLRQGDWEGKQILSPEAVRAVTSAAGTPGYCGIGWWSNNKGTCAALPKDAFWGSGAGHQVVLVVPSLHLIAVRNGRSLAEVHGDPFDYAQPTFEWIFEPLIKAITAPGSPIGAVSGEDNGAATK